MAEKAQEAAGSTAIGPVLQPGQIRATEDDEPPWWRFYAIVGGVAVAGLVILGVVALLGRGAPAKAPLRPAAPGAPTAMDLDDLPADTFAKPLPLPGAGVVPQEKTPKGARVAAARPKKGGGQALPKVEGPAEPAEKKKPSGAIIYQPRGPI